MSERSTSSRRAHELVEDRADASTVILIAAPKLATRIASLFADVEVVGFNDLRELDRWRSGAIVRRETIRADVEIALDELGLPLASLSSRLRTTFEAICHEQVVPSVTDLEKHWPSRRSFYRAWAAELPLAPSAFLRRVRVLRAELLIDEGASPKEAAFQAGFGSADLLRRLLAKERRERHP